jgi:hypothetical protein
VWRPAWLGPEDHPWLAALLDEARRFAGRPLREWHLRAAEPLRAGCPAWKQQAAVRALDGLCPPSPSRKGRSPAELREALFLEAQRARDADEYSRGAVVARVAAALGLGSAHPAGLGSDVLADELFSDLPTERRFRLPQVAPDACGLALRTNLLLAQRLLRSASSLEVELSSRSRDVVRQVMLQRLLCTARATPSGPVVEISGPLSLFHHTTVYGRALASIVPVLRGADSFAVRAECAWRGQPRTVLLQSGDPLFPVGPAPRAFDSRLEEQFARDFSRAMPDWDVLREPEPVPVAGTWIFPDFALMDRRTGERRWLVEIVGFWTPDYLRAKLERLAQAARDDLILCVDDRLACGPAELPPSRHVVRFHRRVDVDAVCRAMEAGPARPPAGREHGPSATRLGPGDLFLDYAGRHPAEHAIHARLVALAPGCEVRLRAAGPWLLIADRQDAPLAALSAAAAARWRPRLGALRAVRVVEVLERRAAQSAAAYRRLLRVERWRVPVVEVLHGP